MTEANDPGAVRAVQSARERVEAIRLDQPDRDAREGSQVALMREFLRRAALWANALDCDGDWPFFSVADALAQRSEAVRSRLKAHGLENFESGFKALGFRASRIAGWFVQWRAIDNLDEVRAFGLPEPYEPAILIFERGGNVQVENRMFQFNLASFPMGRVEAYLEKPPFTALDADSLAGQDETWRLEIERRRRSSS